MTGAALSPPGRTRLPGLDYRAAPLTSAVTVLREIALESLGRLLGAGNGSLQPEERMLALEPLLAPAGLPPSRSASAWRHLTGRLRFARPPADGEPIQVLLGDHLRHAARGRFRLPWHPRPASGLYLPKEAWALLAQAAWGTPDFHLRASALVREELARRHLLHPFGALVPRLAPGSGWLLVVSGLDPRAVRRLRRRRAVRCIETLYDVAARQLAGPGWAGVWDAWLAGRIARDRPGAWNRFPADLAGLLAGLPSPEAADPAPEHPLLRPGWLDDRPAWLSHPLVSRE